MKNRREKMRKWCLFPMVMCFFVCVFYPFHISFPQDTLTVVTYYPSPAGVYRELKVIRDGETITLGGGDSNNPAIELRDTDSDGHHPYIDFSNDSSSDYDIRIILRDDNTLDIVGGELKAEISSEGGDITVCP